MAITLSGLGSSKTRRFVTLTSGTSWTVPTGVTYINVTLYGGGGGGGGVRTNADFGISGPGAGGTTTFTGATSAVGGNAGTNYNSGTAAAVNTDSQGQRTLTKGAPQDNTGFGGPAALCSMSFNTSNFGMVFGGEGNPGSVISSTLSTTPGASISYSIGAGGSGASCPTGSGGAGASGKIEIEYWV